MTPHPKRIIEVAWCIYFILHCISSLWSWLLLLYFNGLLLWCQTLNLVTQVFMNIIELCDVQEWTILAIIRSWFMRKIGMLFDILLFDRKPQDLVSIKQFWFYALLLCLWLDGVNLWNFIIHRELFWGSNSTFCLIVKFTIDFVSSLLHFAPNFD